MNHQPLALRCATFIDKAFANYNFHFHAVTQRARRRFRERDWLGSQRDAVQRIELYDRAVKKTVHQLRGILGEHATDRALWQEIKANFEGIISPYRDLEFTKTFFSSITRRIFTTVGVDPSIEFLGEGEESVNETSRYGGFRTYPNPGSMGPAVENILGSYAFKRPYIDLAGCTDYVRSQIEAACAAEGEGYSVHTVDMLRKVFYRDYRAYLVGRINGARFRLPLIIAIRNGEEGLKVDGVITETDKASMVFSFTRSYFHADLDTVHDAVAFIRSILPQKPISEIYTFLGRAKQGKTERYRTFFHNLENSDDQFADAAYDRGMVMVVFTLPSFPVVFKVIRDRFAYPKTTVRKDVIDKYRLVFKHDRAGRLVDAQEFRYLKFHKSRFEPELLEELLNETGNTTEMSGDDVVIEHAYIERRLVPLNVFIQQVEPERARRAILDYGQAIRDLACSNIFPGDLLLKNFGVTRHDRVIFYDYDELCLVTECNFRDIPEPRTHEEEMRAGAWYYVGENDIFPEQFTDFLGITGALLDEFRELHGDILRADYWRGLQKRLEAGEVIDIIPYTCRQD